MLYICLLGGQAVTVPRPGGPTTCAQGTAESFKTDVTKRFPCCAQAIEEMGMRGRVDGFRWVSHGQVWMQHMHLDDV